MRMVRLLLQDSKKINSTAARAKSLKERTIGLPHALLNIYKNENNIEKKELTVLDAKPFSTVFIGSEMTIISRLVIIC